MCMMLQPHSRRRFPRGFLKMTVRGAVTYGNFGQLHDGRVIMRLRFLGKHSTPGGSPTLWSAGEDKYVIQGYTLEPGALAQVGDIPAGESVVWVPGELMRYLPEVLRGAARPGQETQPGT
jgi:hypothetical protein